MADRKVLDPAVQGRPLDMSVAVLNTGRVVIDADPYIAATLAGREGFADGETVRAELERRIADAWYAADCPPARDEAGGAL